VKIKIHKAVIPSVVLYERELRVSENRVLRGIFGLTREKVHYLNASPYTILVIKSRRMRWAGHVARVGR
jgi:hypothetical protein